MKKVGLFTGVLLLVCNIELFAQGNEIDAFTLSNSELGGTARSMAMGGAFGSLGGDLSVISNNPAGLGIYRSSEIAGTFDLSMVNASTSWGGVNTDRNKTRFTPNNYGFTLYFPTNSESVRNWNLGFSYNRLKNYNRSYKMSNKGQNYSMADYVAWRASNAFGSGNGITREELTYVKDGYDPYNNKDLAGQWLPVLGYEAGFYDHYAGGQNEYQSSFGRKTGNEWVIDSPYKNSLIVNERGHMDEYNIGLGMNISDFLFLGASISITDISYRYSSYYEDLFAYDKKDDQLYLENSLNTEGTAVSVNVGAIMNLQLLRLGVAYNSPRWYDMTDYFWAQAGTYVNGYDDPSIKNQTPEDAYSEYRFRTPDKWIFSGSVILGQSALISADYEIMDYRKMHFSDKDGYDGGYSMNGYIDDDYTSAHTLKLGAEIKVTPQFAVRAGYMTQTSPMRKALFNNDVEVLPAGTIPHFTVASKPTNYYTVGLGYRFTPNFYIDLACAYRYNSSHAYAFSNTYKNDKTVDVYSEPGSLKTKTTRLVLTLGYKF